MYVSLTFHIKLVSLQILIFDKFMGQNLSNLVRMSKYGIWFFAHNSFFVQSIQNVIFEFLRPLASSYKQNTHNLGFGMLGDLA